ncbi:MAG: BlaI/MecI/CopY family transcriptional regulator [Candidatus Thermoplasmatota archaeon]|nr:BlaI/MecI/CopY family transcriptional regulator [Candidatus Thermoplasmatota archaeon]
MTRNIGPLERKILAVLWEKREATAREICTCLEDCDERRAYSTIRTIIKRLVRKKIISQHRHPTTRQYIYSPLVTKDELETTIVKTTLSDLLKRFEQSTINYLAEELSDSKEDIEKIKQKLAEMKKDE